MFNEKRGLSTVVTTLIIILLVLVAIGIIWIVVKGVITGSGEQIDINTKCVTTNLDVSASKCTIATSTCTATVNKAGGYALDGVKIVFSNSTASGAAIAQTGDIIVTKTFSSLSPGVTLTVPTSVKVAGYFTDDKGQQITCPQVAELNNVTIA